MSAMTKAFDGVPYGVRMTVVVSHSGAPAGMRFWKNDLPPAPSGKRCSMTGRSRMARITVGSTAR